MIVIAEVEFEHVYCILGITPRDRILPSKIGKQDEIDR